MERLIHGAEAEYNKVPIWDYSKLGALFGPTEVNNGKFKYYSARTPGELSKILDDKEFCTTNPTSGVTQVVEIFVGVLDAPVTINLITKAIEEFNTVK